MSLRTLRGSGTVSETAQLLRETVLNCGFSCELVEEASHTFSGITTTTLVFEKYYWRASNRASLTAVVMGDGRTVSVDLIGSGGGSGALLSFSWGAEESFVDSAAKELEKRGFR